MTILRNEVVCYGVRDLREAKAITSEVDLTHPVAGATTQEDANKMFHERILGLEEEIDGGNF